VIRFLLIALAPLTAAADWPQFRGPTQQGHADAKGLPVEWGPDKNVVWKIPVPGKGWSSPVVAGGRIYLTTAVPNGEAPKPGVSLRTICYEAATGKLLWDTEVIRADGAGLPNVHSKNSQASPTAVVSGDKVFVHFGHLGTGCVTATDGKVVWVNRDLKYAPVHGNGGSPVLHDGKLIFCVDGADRQEVVALNAADGTVAWRTPRSANAKKSFSFSTPLVTDVIGVTQLVCAGSDVVMSLEPATGKELWRVKYTGYSVVPRPVTAEGLIFLSTGYDSAKLLAIRPSEGRGDLTASAVVWKADKNAPYNPSMVVADGLLYAVSDSGMATCWEAGTGKVVWSERVPDKYSSSIVYAEGRLYLQSETGVGTVLRAGRTFETLATNKLEERSLASYAVDGKALLIRTESNLYRIETK
jgi:outer membrane protein assembly factor BamB